MDILKISTEFKGKFQRGGETEKIKTIDTLNSEFFFFFFKV